MVATASSSPFRFLDLPVELRLMIYDLLDNLSEHPYQFNHAIPAESKPLTQTCRVLRTEVISHLAIAGKIKFGIHHVSLIDKVLAMKDYVQGILTSLSPEASKVFYAQPLRIELHWLRYERYCEALANLLSANNEIPSIIVIEHPRNSIASLGWTALLRSKTEAFDLWQGDTRKRYSMGIREVGLCEHEAAEPKNGAVGWLAKFEEEEWSIRVLPRIERERTAGIRTSPFHGLR
ncbi:MAG: hypothetical protein M1820_010089 [Bogoriella megaspora]|nr:MAG: hypothetical protein M1820_010089 [Bogoriella megaspora]